MKAANRRTRRQQFVQRARLYGIASAVLLALAVLFWFLVHEIGIFLLCFACIFTVIAIGYIALEWSICRALEALGRSSAAPYALVTEYGHLVLCGGSEEDVRTYAGFCADAYAKMYRPVDEKPNKDQAKAGAAEQKRLLEEEKRLAKALSPFRQFDQFTPADLPLLQGKHIFVSERMYRIAAAAEDWNAARRDNAIEIIPSPALGKSYH